MAWQNNTSPAHGMQQQYQQQQQQQQQGNWQSAQTGMQQNMGQQSSWGQSSMGQSSWGQQNNDMQFGQTSAHGAGGGFGNSNFMSGAGGAGGFGNSNYMSQGGQPGFHSNMGQQGDPRQPMLQGMYGAAGSPGNSPVHGGMPPMPGPPGGGSPGNFPGHPGGSPDNGGSNRARSKSDALRDMSIEYEYSVLNTACGGFAKCNELGVGAYGAVYRAEMRDGSEAAVKVIDLAALGDKSELSGFEDEIAVLSKFRHPNLILLMGWSRQAQKRFLIYEFITGGDLQKRLLKCKEPSAEPYCAGDRISTAIDAGRGLAYLHNATPHAFHRDIKSANILLQVGGGAKMADFGLSCVAEAKRGPISNADGTQNPTDGGACGTPGYICPIYIKTGRITEGSEVYSFGMVLLELLVNLYPCVVNPQTGGLDFPLNETLRLADPDPRRAQAFADPTAAWPPELAGELAAIGFKCVDSGEQCEVRRPPFNDICRALSSMQSKFADAIHDSSDQMTQVRSQAMMTQGSSLPDRAPELPAELVLECLHSQGHPSGVPPQMRTIRLQAHVLPENKCAVQVGKSGPAAAWLAGVLPGFQPVDARAGNEPVAVYFEVGWDRALGGAPMMPRVSCFNNGLGNIYVDGKFVEVGESAFLKEGSQLKFSLEEGVEYLVLSLAIVLPKPKTRPPAGWGANPQANRLIPSLEVDDASHGQRRSQVSDDSKCRRCAKKCTIL